MTLRESLLLVHVLAAMIWLGGGVLLVAFGRRTLRRGNAGATTAYLRDSEFAGQVFGASTALVLGSGIWLVFEVSAWGFDQAWILVGLILGGAMFLMGPAYHVPQVKRRIVAAEEKGGTHSDVVGAVGRWLRIATVEVGVMVFVLWLMIVKPWM